MIPPPHHNIAAAAHHTRRPCGAALGLIGALTPQLEYYFSPSNLLGDTYLKTLMDLNSGYVPVGVIVNFGNVQRIVARWDGADGSGGVVGAEPAGVQSLIREAADRSALLDVVWIDGSGRKVADEGAAAAAAAYCYSARSTSASNRSGDGDDDKSGGVDNGAAAGEEEEEAKKAQTGNKGGAGGAIANRIAIGPKNAGGVSGGGGGVMTGAPSTAIATPHGQQLPQKQVRTYCLVMIYYLGLTLYDCFVNLASSIMNLISPYLYLQVHDSHVLFCLFASTFIFPHSSAPNQDRVSLYCETRRRQPPRTTYGQSLRRPRHPLRKSTLT